MALLGPVLLPYEELLQRCKQSLVEGTIAYGNTLTRIADDEIAIQYAQEQCWRAFQNEQFQEAYDTASHALVLYHFELYGWLRLIEHLGAEKTQLLHEILTRQAAVARTTASLTHLCISALQKSALRPLSLLPDEPLTTCDLVQRWSKFAADAFETRTLWAVTQVFWALSDEQDALLSQEQKKGRNLETLLEGADGLRGAMVEWIEAAKDFQDPRKKRPARPREFYLSCAAQCHQLSQRCWQQIAALLLDSLQEFAV